MGTSLAEAAEWVSGAEPRVQSKGQELQQARQALRQLQVEASQLFEQVEQVQQAISALESQIAAMESQLNNASDDDDDGSAAALRSQISALQGQLSQYRTYRAQLLSRLQEIRSEMMEKKQTISVAETQLGRVDSALDQVSNVVTQQYRTTISEKEKYTGLTSNRFASSSASEVVGLLQQRLNVCTNLFSRIRSMKEYIQDLLSSGDERDEREKKLTRGPSR